MNATRYYVLHRSEYGPAIVAGPMTYTQALAWIAAQPADYAHDCSITD